MNKSTPKNKNHFKLKFEPIKKNLTGWEIYFLVEAGGWVVFAKLKDLLLLT